MKTTKVFKSGNSLAVRLPKEFHFQGEIVEIFKRGNDVVIREVPRNLSEAFNLLIQLSDDFYTDKRTDHLPQRREPF
jgi:antitoxin VapB